MIKLILLAVVPFITEHRNVSPSTKVSTNFYGSVTGIVDRAYIESHGGDAVNTNEVEQIVNRIVGSTSVTNLGAVAAAKDYTDAQVASATPADYETVSNRAMNSVQFDLDAKSNRTALTIGTPRQGNIGEDSVVFGSYSSATKTGSFANGDNANAYGDYSHAEGDNTTASGRYAHAEGSSTTASGYSSHAEGAQTTAIGNGAHAEGYNTIAKGVCSHASGMYSSANDSYSYVWGGTEEKINQVSKGIGTFCIYPMGGIAGFFVGGQSLDSIIKAQIDPAISSAISAADPAFSNAVLAVGLNIDTNSVAVLNEIAATFGGFPLGAGETATTVGGLLAALAAAVAWLKKNKVGSFESVGGASATVENGVAKLNDFFTESNSLLTGTIDARLPYPLNAVTDEPGLLKDRAINTTSLASVTVPDNFTDLLVRASVASSLSVTMPDAIATKYGDTFPGEAGEYLITITKTGAAEAYVRTIKLEEVANA